MAATAELNAENVDQLGASYTVKKSDALCGDSGNEFYEFSQIRHQLMAVRSILIAGRTRQVNKIMTYKLSWMRNNYFGPMNRLADRFNPQRRLIRAMVESDCVIS
ncbi:unnamed protein product [Rotaria sordida]|uniref:Uncharacterized protein n=1 Tax=Rotaria sordida TaxID=392033 RepID=A0A814ZA56_9BILA|nr:unnamed protein product [Rotaria sordida]